MELPDIDEKLMKAASDALDKAIKDGKTAAEARAAFEAVLKGGAAEQPVVEETPPAEIPTKPARKPRSDKGQSRKKAPPKPEELAAVASGSLPPSADAMQVGAMVINLFAALKSATGGAS